MTEADRKLKNSEFTKPNSKGNNDQQPPQPNTPPPTMKCFIIPIDQMEMIRDAVRDAPHRIAHPVLAGIAQLQVADVPIGPPQQVK